TKQWFAPAKRKRKQQNAYRNEVAVAVVAYSLLPYQQKSCKNGDKNKGRKSPYGTLPTCVERMLAAEALLQPSA
ncbi:hypothetical protein, partial [Alloprevotella tannerae]|uniref:hypothetical protein n=1 Tax=Alloprevotella tannerae TaxID=76122 RepID=UPI003C6FF9F6